MRLIFYLLLYIISIGAAFAMDGGDLAKKGEFPSYVRVYTEDGHSCGGTIISPYHVLTTAGCLVDEQFNKVHQWSLKVVPQISLNQSTPLDREERGIRVQKKCVPSILRNSGRIIDINSIGILLLSKPIDLCGDSSLSAAAFPRCGRDRHDSPDTWAIGIGATPSGNTTHSSEPGTLRKLAIKTRECPYNQPITCFNSGADPRTRVSTSKLRLHYISTYCFNSTNQHTHPNVLLIGDYGNPVLAKNSDGTQIIEGVIVKQPELKFGVYYDICGFSKTIFDLLLDCSEDDEVSVVGLSYTLKVASDKLYSAGIERRRSSEVAIGYAGCDISWVGYLVQKFSAFLLSSFTPFAHGLHQEELALH